MAKLACLPMFGRRYKLKNAKPDHLPYNEPRKPMEASLLVSPECVPVKTKTVVAATDENVVWEGNLVGRPTFEEAHYDVVSSVSDEDGRVDNLKVDGQHSAFGEAEYEGGDEADKDVGADHLVEGHSEQIFDSGHLGSGDRRDGCEKEVQDYYESPRSIPSCLTERSSPEIDIQSGHVSDPGTLWATLQSQCEPLARSRSGGFSETKAVFEENESCGHRLSDYSLNSGQVDATYVPSGIVVHDYGSFASGDKASTVRNLSHQGYVSTRSEGSAPTAGDGVFSDMGAGNGMISARTRKPWWKVTLRAHRSIPSSSKIVEGTSQSSPLLEDAPPPVQSYGSDGDVSGGIISPESADLITCETVESIVNFGDASEAGNAVHRGDLFVPHGTEPMHGDGGDGSEMRPAGVWPYLLSPSHLNGFQGCSMSAFPAKHRVEEWISKIDLTLPAEDEAWPLSETPCAVGANGKVLGENLEDSRVRQHKDQEAVLASAVLDVDMAFALAAARTLHPLATVALFPGVGLKTVPPLVMFNLKTINLSANALVRIPPGCFPKSVHHLDLSRNKIVAIEGLRELTRLRVLNMSANRITRIGHGLANSTSLRELYLGANKISEVEGLHRLLKLNVLDLSHNKVTSSKALNQLAANYQSLQALNLLGNGVCKNLGEEQLRKFVLGIAPHVGYLNKQPLKSVHGREAVMDSVAKAALGSATVHHGQRGSKSSTKSAKKGLGLQQQLLPPGHKRSASGDPAKIGLVQGQISSRSHGNLASLRQRQGHGHQSRQQSDRPASKEKRSADSSPLFQFESLPVPDADPVMLRIQSDSALNLQDKS